MRPFRFAVLRFVMLGPVAAGILAACVLGAGCGESAAPRPASAPTGVSDRDVPSDAAAPSSTPAPASASAGAGASAAPVSSAAAPAPAPPVPTGGSVLIGDIAAPRSFDPRPVLVGLQGQLLGCYNQARVKSPSLHGKVKLVFRVNEAGAVLSADAEPGGSANDPALVACLGEVLKAASFGKPGGTATVSAPLLFRP